MANNTVHFNKCGISSDHQYIMAIGKASAGKDVEKPTWTMTVFKNRCPACGSELRWGIFWNGTESSGKWAKFPCTGRVEGGSAEGHIFCTNGDCDKDYSVQGHDHGGGGRSLSAVTKRVKSSKAMARRLVRYGLDYDLESNKVVGSSSGVTTSTYTKGYDKDTPFKAYLKIGYSIGTKSKPYTSKSKTYYIYLDFSEDSSIQRDSFSEFTTVWINNAFRKNSADIVDRISKLHDDIDKNNRYYLRSVSFVHDKTDEDLYNSDGSDNSSCKMLLKTMGFRKGDALNPKVYDTCGQTLLQSIQSILEDCDYNTELIYKDFRNDDYLNFYLKSNSPVFTIREDSVNFLGINNITYKPLEDTHNSSYQLFKQKQENGTELWRYVNSRHPKSVLMYGENQVLGKMDGEVNSMEAYQKARYDTKEFSSDMPFTYSVEWRGIPPIKVGDSVECVFDKKEYNDIKTVESLNYKCTNDDACNFITEIGLGELSPMIKLKKNIKNQRRKTKAKDTKYTGGAVYPEDAVFYEFEE